MKLQSTDHLKRSGSAGGAIVSGVFPTAHSGKHDETHVPHSASNTQILRSFKHQSNRHYTARALVTIIDRWVSRSSTPSWTSVCRYNGLQQTQTSFLSRLNNHILTTPSGTISTSGYSHRWRRHYITQPSYCRLGSNSNRKASGAPHHHQMTTASQNPRSATLPA